MKKYFVNVVVISCVSIFISGCLGSLHRKPIPSLEDSGVVIKADENGNISFSGKDGLTFEPCGEEFSTKCPPIIKNEGTVIGAITELKVDKGAKLNEGVRSDQNAVMARSANSQPDCPRAIKIGSVTLIKKCPDQ